MNPKTFDWIVEKQLENCKNTLIIKAKEYRREDNPMHNFDRAAAKLRCSRERAIIGFATKHDVSILDMIDDVEKGILPTEAVLNEKIGDMINYLILLKASFIDKIQKQNKNE